MENTDKFQVHLTIEDFIELPWRRVHHKICHDADLGIRKTSLCCFCVQFLPDKINFLFLKHCHLPVCQGNQDMPAGWNKEQSGDFLSCSVGGSVSADPQMADRACNPWPFHRSEQAGCAKATEWGGYSPSTAMSLFFFPPDISCFISDILCVSIHLPDMFCLQAPAGSDLQTRLNSWKGKGTRQCPTWINPCPEWLLHLEGRDHFVAQI